MTTVRKTLSELAHLVGGRVIGDGNVEISSVASIEEAGPGDITFLTHPRYRPYLKAIKAGAIIVGERWSIAAPTEPLRGFLRVSEPYLAFAKILNLFHPLPRYNDQVSPHSSIDPTAILAEGVTAFPFVYVGRGVKVGKGSVLFPGVFLGDGSEVGEDCVLHPHVTVRERCRLGNRVILHAGAVIGADGFGYAGGGKGLIKIPQVGTVQIGDDVEIGANATVDRATLGRTVIGRGTKIDNLVQIAHNVVVGEDTMIGAQTGVAGSTRVGNGVILAGQVGVVNHVEIGDKATVGPQSGIARSVPAGALLSGGLEAAPHREWVKVMTIVPRLPELWSAVHQIKRRLSALARGGRKGVKGHARRQRDL